MALPSTAVAAALETVRRTNTAHLDAVDALERAVGAEMVRHVCEAPCDATS